MNKILLSLILLFGISNLNAFDVTTERDGVTGNIVNEVGLTYDSTFDVPVEAYEQNKVSVVLTYSSAPTVGGLYLKGVVRMKE